MKKIAVLAMSAATIVVVLALAAIPALAGSGTQNDPFGPGDKVTFCHYDGSEQGGGSGKYNQPDASTTATGPAGHIGHSFDVIPSYFFQQNANAQVEFFGGVNWPILNNLPSSPIDFTPLLGSSASTFIASGCAAPAVSTTTPVTTSSVPPTTTTPPPTTTTVPPVHTTTAPPVTTAPPTTTTPPPAGGGNPPPGPGGNPNPNNNPPNNPPNKPPTELAFTGSESAVPLGIAAGLLALLGSLALLRARALTKEEG